MQIYQIYIYHLFIYLSGIRSSKFVFFAAILKLHLNMWSHRTQQEIMFFYDDFHEFVSLLYRTSWVNNDIYALLLTMQSTSYVKLKKYHHFLNSRTWEFSTSHNECQGEYYNSSAPSFTSVVHITFPFRSVTMWKGKF